MSENKNKIPPPMSQLPPQPPQQNPIVGLAQAINHLANRVSMLEIETRKATSNCEILEKTIKLIEKRMDFNEKKNEKN